MDRETARPKGLAAFKAAGVKVESAAALKRQPLKGRVVARRAPGARSPGVATAVLGPAVGGRLAARSPTARRRSPAPNGLGSPRGPELAEMAELHAENEKLRAQLENEKLRAQLAQMQSDQRLHSPPPSARPTMALEPGPEPEPVAQSGLVFKAFEPEPEPEPEAGPASAPAPAPPPATSHSPKTSAFTMKNAAERFRKNSRKHKLSRSTTSHSMDFEVQAQNVTHGQLEFISHGLDDERQVLDSDTDSLKEARQAKFIRVAMAGAKDPILSIRDTSRQKDRVKLIQGLCTFMSIEWGLEPPSVIISVTGNANDVKLRPQFEEQFKAALLSATRSTNAWITTGGTNVGVMRLVGDALKEYKRMSMCIGFLPWGPLAGKESLEPPPGAHLLSKARNSERKGTIDNPFKYTGARSATDGNTTALDKNHSHYIIVDNNEDNMFGTEIQLRNELEDFVSFRHDKTGETLSRLVDRVMSQTGQSKRSIPVIVVVFGGGPGTVEQVHAAAKSGKPIILVKGSKRLAGLIIDLLELSEKMQQEEAAPADEKSASPRSRASVLPPPSPLTAASRGSPSMPPPSPRTAAARRNETEQAMHALIEQEAPQFLSKKAVIMEILRHPQLHIFGKRKR